MKCKTSLSLRLDAPDDLTDLRVHRYLHLYHFVFTRHHHNLLRPSTYLLLSFETPLPSCGRIDVDVENVQKYLWIDG